MGDSNRPESAGIPVWAWWTVGLLGLALHTTFLLRGNLGLNKDLVFFSEQIRSYALGSEPVREAGGLRFWVGLLFFRMTGGWPNFASLASLFLVAIPLVLLLRWTHRNISAHTAFFLALFLSIPPPAMAYYDIHLDERRLETILWGILLLTTADVRKPSFERMGLLGLILGWAFWGEPFILFFVLPILQALLRQDRTWKGMAVPLAFLSLGTALGLLVGWEWNVPFLRYYPREYFHWGSAAGSALHHHLGLLVIPFPQFWGGNFPFGYFQASGVGQSSFRTDLEGIAPYLGAWFGGVSLVAFLGYVWNIFRERRDSLPALCLGLPTLLYLLFFLFSSHVIDAMSFRYLAFLVPGLGFGCALAFGSFFKKKPRSAMAVLGLFLLFQGAALGRFLLALPKHFPSAVLATGFEDLGLKEGWLNQWAALPARYLNGRSTDFHDYYDLLLPDRRIPDFPRDRIGLAYLPGLDRPEGIGRALTALEGRGYRPGRTWTMKEGWSILELRRSGPQGGQPPALQGEGSLR